MQIKLVDQDHLQFGPVTVALANHRILSLICRLAGHDGGEAKPHRPAPPRVSCH